MKKLDIEILQQYKLYRENTKYSLNGDLIILSGINGSGKSQLFQIIAKNRNEKVSRKLTQISDDGSCLPIEIFPE